MEFKPNPKDVVHNINGWNGDAPRRHLRIRISRLFFR
jgi:hypothetical protein